MTRPYAHQLPAPDAPPAQHTVLPNADASPGDHRYAQRFLDIALTVFEQHPDVRRQHPEPLAAAWSVHLQPDRSLELFNGTMTLGCHFSYPRWRVGPYGPAVGAVRYQHVSLGRSKLITAAEHAELLILALNSSSMQQFRLRLTQDIGGSAEKSERHIRTITRLIGELIAHPTWTPRSSLSWYAPECNCLLLIEKFEAGFERHPELTVSYDPDRGDFSVRNRFETAVAYVISEANTV